MFVLNLIISIFSTKLFTFLTNSMKQMLQICCKNNNNSKEFPIGSSLLDIYYGFNLNFPYQVVSAKVNNRSEGT